MLSRVVDRCRCSVGAAIRCHKLTAILRCRRVLRTKITLKQDNQALLMAKYCPWVAAASGTQKNTHKTRVTLTVDLMKFDGVVEVV